MTIQQVSGGTNNGILGFLFQDDGAVDGPVLEGAAFARTLQQLMGEPESGTPPQFFTPASTAPVAESVGAELTLTVAPETALPESMPGAVALPALSADLPEAVAPDSAITAEPAVPFWTTPVSSNSEHAAQQATRAPAPAAAEPELPTRETAEIPPSFSHGIQHVIELAREVQQSTAAEAPQLAGATQPQRESAAPEPVQATAPPAQVRPTTQPTAVTQPALPAVLPEPALRPAHLPQTPGFQNPSPLAGKGRNLPESGKALPQGFRPLNFTLTPVASSTAQARQLRMTSAADALPLAAANDAAAAPTLNGPLAADVPGAEPRGQQNAAAFAQTLTPIMQAARAEPAAAPSALGATPATESAPQPQSGFVAGSEAWFEDLGTRVDWLKNMNIEKAELQLHPAELGLLEIHIATGDDATSVSFVTHNPAARELIEANLPRLRELLASQGMQLGDSQVSQHSSGDRSRPEPDSAGAALSQDEAATPEPAQERGRVYLSDPNRIDHYV